MTREEIQAKVTETLGEMFSLSPGKITPEARLAEDLDLDSIDAIDLAARLHELTGKRLAEDDLRRIRKVSDIVDVVERMLRTRNA